MESLFPLLLLIVIFYFMLIRPQQRRLKQHQALISGLAVGDEVVTIGGMLGVVRRLEDDEVVLEVAEDILVRFSRQAISKKKEPGVEEGSETASEPAELPEVDSQ